MDIIKYYRTRDKDGDGMAFKTISISQDHFGRNEHGKHAAKNSGGKTL
jgi:hypothetical protein